MTYPQGMDLWFALPDGEEAACAAGRVRVYQVDGAEWTLLEHRCETDDASGVWAVTTLTHFSTYVMVIDDAPATPTPVPTATPTSTPTAQEMMTPSPIPPGRGFQKLAALPYLAGCCSCSSLQAACSSPQALRSCERAPRARRRKDRAR